MDVNQTIEPTAKSLFLEHLSQTGNVMRSCQRAGVHRSTVYLWRSEDADFAKAWKHAQEDASDLLEEEAWRRAVTGVEKPVFYQGDECGIIREYSDTLLAKLLAANNPEKFRENVNLRADVNANVNHSGEVVLYIPQNNREAEGSDHDAT